MAKKEFDLAVIGAGTGGYAAAIRASELGMRVALIEKDKVGGVCLHRGCIPTKALLHTAELIEDIRRAGNYGIDVSAPNLQWQKMMESKQGIVDRLYGGLQGLLKGHKIEIKKGLGRLDRPGGILIDNNGDISEIRATHQVIATGSAPKTLGLPIDGNRVITSDDALNLAAMPSSVVILGGGSVGVEFASMWRSFGAKVTIIEIQPHILPSEDEDIARHLEQALKSRGITIHSGVKFEGTEFLEDGVAVTISFEDRSEKISSEKLMVAVGRGGVSDGLGLDRWNIKSAKGFIEVDKQLATASPGTFAVGDIINTPQFAYVGFAEGIFAAENIAGLNPAPLDYEQIPRCVYTYPEVAAVGLTEKQTNEKNIATRVSVFPFQANSKANILGETAGICKLIAAEGGPLIGVHLVGPRVTELIAEGMLATNWEAMPEDLAALIHPHPTLSENIGEAALKLAGKPLNIGNGGGRRESRSEPLSRSVY